MKIFNTSLIIKICKNKYKLIQMLSTEDSKNIIIIEVIEDNISQHPNRIIWNTLWQFNHSNVQNLRIAKVLFIAIYKNKYTFIQMLCTEDGISIIINAIYWRQQEHYYWRWCQNTQTELLEMHSDSSTTQICKKMKTAKVLLMLSTEDS